MQARGYSKEKYYTLESGYYCRPTEYQESSYGVRVGSAIRFSDSSLLRRLLAAGISPNAYSIYGDSVVHLVCNRGDYSLLKILVEHGGSVSVCDDQGKTPLHDACWSAEPCFELVKFLLELDKHLLSLMDCKGRRPLEYVNDSKYKAWIQFLKANIDHFWPIGHAAANDFPDLTREGPHSYPAPDPQHELGLDNVILVANGILEPEEFHKIEPSFFDAGDYHSCVSEVDSIDSEVERKMFHLDIEVLEEPNTINAGDSTRPKCYTPTLPNTRKKGVGSFVRESNRLCLTDVPRERKDLVMPPSLLPLAPNLFDESERSRSRRKPSHQSMILMDGRVIDIPEPSIRSRSHNTARTNVMDSPTKSGNSRRSWFSRSSSTRSVSRHSSSFRRDRTLDEISLHTKSEHTSSVKRRPGVLRRLSSRRLRDLAPNATPEDNDPSSNGTPLDKTHRHSGISLDDIRRISTTNGVLKEPPHEEQRAAPQIQTTVDELPIPMTRTTATTYYGSHSSLKNTAPSCVECHEKVKPQSERQHRTSGRNIPFDQLPPLRSTRSMDQKLVQCAKAAKKRNYSSPQKQNNETEFSTLPKGLTTFPSPVSTKANSLESSLSRLQVEESRLSDALIAEVLNVSPFVPELDLLPSDEEEGSNTDLPMSSIVAPSGQRHLERNLNASFPLLESKEFARRGEMTKYSGDGSGSDFASNLNASFPLLESKEFARRGGMTKYSGGHSETGGVINEAEQGYISSDSSDDIGIETEGTAVQGGDSNDHKQNIGRDLVQIGWQDVKVQSFLGSGEFSSVYKVRLTNHLQGLAANESPFFALKCQSEHSKRNSIVDTEPEYMMNPDDLSHEAMLLSKLSHENIICLHGSNDETGPFGGRFLLLELLEETLTERLNAWRRSLKNPLASLFPKPQQQTAGNILDRIQACAFGISSGMEYLHQNDIILRDLKPANIGFDMSGAVKLFDFGLAKDLKHCKEHEYGTVIAGSLRYMAPEIALARGSDKRSDVYSFGVLMFEICTLQRPFEKFAAKRTRFKDKVFTQNYRPSIKGLLHSYTLERIIQESWHFEPESRPTFSEIHKLLVQADWELTLLLG